LKVTFLVTVRIILIEGVRLSEGDEEGHISPAAGERDYRSVTCPEGQEKDRLNTLVRLR
jgi:hypothetical protein